MELELWIIALLCGVYFSAGFIDSIAGGGGLLTVPAFLLTGVPPEVVLGTNKLASCGGMTAALISYSRKGFVLWKAAVPGVLAMLAGGAAGSHVLLLLDSAMIGKVVVILLPLGIFATFLPKKDKGARELSTRDIYLWLPLISLALGFYEGFFGPGTGSFIILALHFLLGFGLLHASGTTKLLNLAGGLSGLFVFILQGKVLYLLALPLMASSIAGNLTGSAMAMRIGPGFIRRILTISLSLLFVSLIWKFF